MRTVESIISDVFGSDADAANNLGVGRTAVLNWKAWGHFPSHVVVRIWQAARERGLALEVDEIPATVAKPKTKKPIIRGLNSNARKADSVIATCASRAPRSRAQ